MSVMDNTNYTITNPRKELPSKDWEKFWVDAQKDVELFEEYKRDAERYRYIRSNKPYIIKMPGTTIYCGGHIDVTAAKFGQALDEAIDRNLRGE